MRQLKPGCFEVRVGLDVRVALIRDGQDLVVVMVGNHNDLRRWLKNL